MGATVVYEIARHERNRDGQAGALLARAQLVSDDGVLRLRDTAGNETPCEATDIAAVIGSTPAFCEIRNGEEARIACGTDIVPQLPLLLKPVEGGAVTVINGDDWDAFPTIRGHAMLPGRCDYGADDPETSPCWAEYRCAEGGRDFHDQLVGHSIIGLLAPGIALEYGRTDYGGNGGAADFAIRPFDDLAAAFVHWLLYSPVLNGLWHGDLNIGSAGVDLFAAAAVAPDRQGRWDTQEDDDDEVDTDDDGYESDEGTFASRDLDLHLPQELIDQVRVQLAALNPQYAAALGFPSAPPPD